MKLLYSYITVPTEGGKIHIDSFVRAFRSLGDVVIENGIYVPAYAGGKESWSLWKRSAVRIAWITDNIRHCWRTFSSARKYKADVLLFRFQPLHEFFLSIFLLSRFYPVVLEINAVRSIEHHQGRPAISDLLDRLSLKCARRCFVVSECLKNHLVAQYGIDAERVAVIENGVDVDEFSPAADGMSLRRQLRIEDRFVLGFVGSFRPWHGVEHMLALAQVLTSKLPELLFLLVGDGPERQSFERNVRERELSDRFLFVGRVAHADIPAYLSAMDVVLAPIAKAAYAGEFHGSPLKLFEYMASARPVIASPLGQIREVIESGVSGLLIDSENTHELAGAILDLYRDPELRRRLGANARGRVMERYTWKINAHKVRALCLDACND